MRNEQLEEIIALETALHKKELRRDSSRLQQLMGDQFKEFGRSGRSYDKASIMAQLLSEPDFEGEIVSWGFEGTALAPDVTMLNYRSAFRDADGVDSNFAWRSSIWKRGDAGAWQMQFHQGTPTNADQLISAVPA
jgi:hypothetical protein